MSSVLASAVALGLFAVVLAPLAWAWRSSKRREIAIGYLVLLVGVGLLQTGFFASSTLADTNVAVRAVVPGSEQECGKVLDLMRQAGLQIDRSDLAQPKVVGNGADQVPPQVAEVLIRCAEASGTGQPDQARPPAQGS